MSQAIQIEKTETGYKFESRGVEYFIQDQDDRGFFAVWTKRKSMANAGSVKMLTLAEMLNGKNRTLSNFATLVA